MKTKLMLISMVAVLSIFFMLSSSHAFTIDGNWTDWGITISDSTTSTPASQLTPSAGINYWKEDTNDLNNDYQVGPGWGGQNFDAEGIYSAISNGYLYFAVVSGARPDNGASNYEPGDIVITTSNATYALETTGFRYNLNDNGYVTSSTAVGVAGGLYKVDGNISDGGTGDTLLKDGLTNWAGAEDPVQLHSASISDLIDSGNFIYTGNSATTRHSFMEGMIALNLLDGDPATIHWAFSCGNDGGTVDSPAVPEPATMLLFGSGLIGLAGLGRKRLLKRG